jgi:hypothetical protein
MTQGGTANLDADDANKSYIKITDKREERVASECTKGGKMLLVS